MTIKQNGANSVIVSNDGAETLFSYGKVIAKKEGGKVALDRVYWNYSKTTGKHRGIFLAEGIAETRKKIDSGEYTLANLNL